MLAVWSKSVTVSLCVLRNRYLYLEHSMYLTLMYLCIRIFSHRQLEVSVYTKLVMIMGEE